MWYDSDTFRWIPSDSVRFHRILFGFCRIPPSLYQILGRQILVTGGECDWLRAWWRCIISYYYTPLFGFTNVYGLWTLLILAKILRFWLRFWLSFQDFRLRFLDSSYDSTQDSGIPLKILGFYSRIWDSGILLRFHRRLLHALERQQPTFIGINLPGTSLF